MPAALRLVVFAAAAVLAGALGWATGDALGPAPPDSTQSPHEHPISSQRAVAP